MEGKKKPGKGRREDRMRRSLLPASKSNVSNLIEENIAFHEVEILPLQITSDNSTEVSLREDRRHYRIHYSIEVERKFEVPRVKGQVRRTEKKKKGY